MADVARQLKIKTSTITRLLKEIDSYKREIVKQREHVARITAEGASESDVRQQQLVLEESEQMLPDSLRRLQVALDDLRDFLVRYAPRCWTMRCEILTPLASLQGGEKVAEVDSSVQEAAREAVSKAEGYLQAQE